MATIEKRGDSYKIVVSSGYDVSGKQLRHRMTWTPPGGLTVRQLEKELQRQALLFEEDVRQGARGDSNIKLQAFTDLFMKDYAHPNLKAKTAFGYAERMKVVNAALGHIKLKDLKPGHIASFYANLQEEGMRRRSSAICNMDLAAWMREHNTTMAKLSRDGGLSIWALKQAKGKRPIALENAKSIAAAMGQEFGSVFTAQHDNTPLKPGTIQTYHRTLSAVLFRAIKWGYIKDNPAMRATLPSIANRKAAYLDEPDARRLLRLLQGEPIKWRALITFDLLSGLRRGELLGLRWGDVDFDTQTITIAQTSNYLPSKGVYVDSPKTAHSHRPLRLSRSAFLLLLEYQRWQNAQRETLGDAWQDRDGRVFTTDIGAPLFPDSLSQWFSKFVVRTGLPRVTVHSLRHTYASLMIADGTPLVVVSHQLGHAQTSTTANIYAHVIKSAEAKAAQTFDKFDDIIISEVETRRTSGQKKAAKT